MAVPSMVLWLPHGKQLKRAHDDATFERNARLPKLLHSTW